MAVAALVTWILTAAGGLFMLSIWISKGGPTERRNDTALAPPVIFGHFGLAALGLVLWIIFVVTGTQALAWVAFALLVPVALLGFIMLTRWLPVYRGARTAPAAASASDTAGASAAASPGASAGAPAAADPPERHFPVVGVAGHGVLAVVTVVLVLLAAISG
jgi:manganese efflux pump family protein